MGQIKDLNDKALMTNLYFTQLMTLVLAVLIILWQKMKYGQSWHGTIYIKLDYGVAVLLLCFLLWM